MLILTRKRGERVMIGDDIVISIIRSNDNQVAIGISADKNLQIDREEIYLRKLKENRKRA